MKNRHTLHSHEQLIDLGAVLYADKDKDRIGEEEKYPLIAQNKMDYTKGFNKIPEIIKLINDTLDNMEIELRNTLPNLTILRQE